MILLLSIFLIHIVIFALCLDIQSIFQKFTQTSNQTKEETLEENQSENVNFENEKNQSQFLVQIKEIYECVKEFISEGSK